MGTDASATGDTDRLLGGIRRLTALADAATESETIFRALSRELLVVPGGFHRLDAKIYKARYPQVKVLCPAGARQKV